MPGIPPGGPPATSVAPTAAAKLASMTSPLGGTTGSIAGRRLGQAVAPSALGPGGLPGLSGVSGDPFADLLVQQLDKAGLSSLSGLAGLGASSGADLLGAAGKDVRGAMALGMMSPELARAVAGRTRSEVAPRKAENAIAWARSLLGRQDWNNLCEQFVEEAYGTKGIYPTAAAAANALVTHRGKLAWRNAPAGALLYFAPDETNQFNGHAGIYLGNGRMISATPTGVREDRLDDPYWAKLFAGWGEPAAFAGRATATATGVGATGVTAGRATPPQPGLTSTLPSVIEMAGAASAPTARADLQRGASTLGSLLPPSVTSGAVRTSRPAPPPPTSPPPASLMPVVPAAPIRPVAAVPTALPVSVAPLLPSVAPPTAPPRPVAPPRSARSELAAPLPPARPAGPIA
ncbi:MAG: C40 family peptidase [Chloroflexi bacterium]|nr:C40 family peptidase [Chloroflexota bacterium]